MKRSEESLGSSEPSEKNAAAPSRTTRHLPVVTALWVRRFGQVLLAAVLVTGLTLPRPGYDAWGILLIGGLLAWLVWLLERLVWRHGQLPGNWIHLGLLGPALILAGHLIVGRLAGGKSGSPSDGITASLMIHAALLSLLVVLTQSFCAARGAARIISAIVGLTMMSSAIGGLLIGGLDPLPNALWLMGLAGVGVWLWPLANVIASPGRSPQRQRVLRTMRLAVAIVAGIALLVLLPSLKGLTVAAGTLAAVTLVSLTRRRSPLLAGLVAAVILIGVGVAVFTQWITPLGGLGGGDLGFAVVTGRDGGLSILAATAGRLGAGLMFLAATAAAGWMLIRSPRDGRRAWATPLAVATAMLATAALWGGGGYVSPSVGMAMAFVWGMLPAAVNMRGRPRGAWWMAGVVLAIMVSLDVASDPGLLVRAAKVISMGDKGMHTIAGFVLAIVLAWWLGSWRWWAGLLMLIVAGLAGEAGELVQKLYTNRNIEAADVAAHVKGVMAAGGFYLLCVAARWAEASGKGRKPWSRGSARVYLGMLLRLAMAGVLVLLISGWCIAAIVTEAGRLARPTPWHIVTDGVVAVPRDRALHIPGTGNDPSLANHLTTYSVDGTGQILRTWHVAKHGRIYIYAKTTAVSPGENHVMSAGRPLGALAYEMTSVTWIGVTFPQRVAALPAETVEAWLAEHPKQLRKFIDALSARGPVVALHPGTALEYDAFRRRMQQELPGVICMNHLIYADGNLARSIALLRDVLRRRTGQPRQQPVDFITTDPAIAALARKILGGSVTVHVMTAPRTSSE